VPDLELKQKVEPKTEDLFGPVTAPRPVVRRPPSPPAGRAPGPADPQLAAEVQSHWADEARAPAAVPAKPAEAEPANAAEAEKAKTEAKPAKADPYRFALDIGTEVPNTIFAHGHPLDQEATADRPVTFWTQPGVPLPTELGLDVVQAEKRAGDYGNLAEAWSAWSDHVAKGGTIDTWKEKHPYGDTYRSIGELEGASSVLPGTPFQNLALQPAPYTGRQATELSLEHDERVEQGQQHLTLSEAIEHLPGTGPITSLACRGGDSQEKKDHLARELGVSPELLQEAEERVAHMAKLEGKLTDWGSKRTQGERNDLLIELNEASMGGPVEWENGRAATTHNPVRDAYDNKLDAARKEHPRNPAADWVEHSEGEADAKGAAARVATKLLAERMRDARREGGDPEKAKDDLNPLRTPAAPSKVA
jgi:hypothetical protein